MLRYNLAYRNLKEYKGAFLISLIGLSSGLACVLLIFLWVQDELRVGKFHKNDGQLYQVMNNPKSTKDIRTLDYTPVPLAAELLKDMPEVERSVAVNDTWDEEGVISAGEARVQAKGLSAGKDFFNVFSYQFLQRDGNQYCRLKRWMFALAGLSGVIVAFIAIGFHTVKAAIANPVDSLKTK